MTAVERVPATLAVDGSIDRVRAVVFDYERTPEFMPTYEKAIVSWTTPSGLRRVHMALGGFVHLWMRVEISPPTTQGAVEICQGRLVQGDVKALRPRWELEARSSRRASASSPSWTRTLPLAPNGLVNSGTRDGVVALKAPIKRKTSGR